MERGWSASESSVLRSDQARTTRERNHGPGTKSMHPNCTAGDSQFCEIKMPQEIRRTFASSPRCARDAHRGSGGAPLGFCRSHSIPSTVRSAGLIRRADPLAGSFVLPPPRRLEARIAQASPGNLLPLAFDLLKHRRGKVRERRLLLLFHRGRRRCPVVRGGREGRDLDGWGVRFWRLRRRGCQRCSL